MKKSTLLICFIIAGLFFYAPAQDIPALIKEGNRLEAVPNEIAALMKFREVIRFQPTNMYGLTKCSELCSRIGKRQKNKKTQDDFYDAARSFATLALKLDPNNSEANCVMAMALGHTSMSKSSKEKISSARDIKKYADASVRLDPNNYKAWHVLGRWHYEISNLSMLEKAAVKVLYGGLPPASIEESIRSFEKVNSITGGFILNYFELAKAYKDNDQKQKAITTLKTMLLLPNHQEEDPILKEEAKALLKDWE